MIKADRGLEAAYYIYMSIHQIKHTCSPSRNCDSSVVELSLIDSADLAVMRSKA